MLKHVTATFFYATMVCMLIEMVTLSLTVLTSLPILTASPISEDTSVALASNMPEKKLIAMLETENDKDAFSDNTISQNEIVAMLEAPSTTGQDEQTIGDTIPTATPTPDPTATPTPLPPTETPTPTPTSTPTPSPTPQATQTQPSPADLESLFARFSDEYKVDKDLLKKIAACESGFNASSHNTAHDYGGMYQFASSTWMTVRGRMGADSNTSLRFSAEESIRTAAYHIANGGRGAWPNCQ
jgi:hypothetical protein